MVIIPDEVLALIAAVVRAAPGVEACGLLLGERDRITEARATPNVSPDPARAFEIAPEPLLAAMRDARRGGPALLGHYHSHPGGQPLPSACDAAMAAADGRLWLIVGDGMAGLWRAVPAGAVQGRFDPVPWVRADAHGLHDMPALFGYGTDHAAGGAASARGT